MVWSTGEWQQKLETLVEQCAEKVLRELEKDITERLKTLGQSIIQDIFTSERSLLLTTGQDPREKMRNPQDHEISIPQIESLTKDEGSTIKPLSNLVWYKFAVIKDREGTPAGLSGLDKATLEIIREGDLGMLVCPVPAGEFCQEALHKHMEDLAWVENYALQHEQILLELMADESFIPLPFCTIFTDIAGIKGQLKESAEFLKEEIERTANQHEISLKLLVKRERLLGRIKEEIPYEGGQAGSGYFLKRQWEKQIEKEIERLTDTYGESLLEKLKQIARSYILLNRTDIEAKGFNTVFAAYFLLPKELHREWEFVLEEFDQTADQWGFVLETSGPWPPYHFTGLQKGEATGGGYSKFEASYASGSGGKIT